MKTRFQRIAICGSAAILAAAAVAVNAAAPRAQRPLAAIAADSSPEEQAMREDLQAQWEADARAAGIDPATATAEPSEGAPGAAQAQEGRPNRHR